MEKEKEKTGIKNMKLGYNRVFGYYIEVSKGNIESVPEYFIRKQTLTNGERYVTPELKELEEEILIWNTKFFAVCAIRRQTRFREFAHPRLLSVLSI